MNIVKEGLIIIKLLTFCAIVFFILGKSFNINFLLMLSLVSSFFAFFCYYFFRNPNRIIVAGENDIICPADGVIMSITEERNEILNRDCRVIRIFLSVFDVHVQRAPIDGIITKIEYKCGKFLPAMNKTAHIENEQNHVLFEDNKNKNRKIICTQIAGLIARKIIMWKKENDTLNMGDLYGMIKFGSQVDIYIPDNNLELNVKPKQIVRGGTTILGSWK